MLARTTVIAGAIALAALTPPPQPPPTPPGTRAFTGATLIDGTGEVMPDAVLLVAGSRIEAAGPASKVRLPRDVERVDLAGRFVIPGLINAHGHAAATVGLESRPDAYTDANLLRQLSLYARYGVTTVVSLGDDRGAGFRLRDGNGDAGLDRARLFLAGPVISAKTPQQARAAVDDAARLAPDWIKIRVDDNLGATQKMAPDVYRAVIERAHQRRLRVAAHIFYLDDAKALLRAGVDYLAHSVRDAAVDRELIDLMKARDVCLCPTLMREVSTFVYETRPAFFDDPFFRREADPAVLAALEDPARQAGVAKNAAAQRYKTALEVARANVKTLHDAGVRLAAGTDTGPPARFQGFFEHLELEEMAKAGLTPAAVLNAATADAARCLGLSDRIGTLQPGRFADFVVLAANPLDDIRHTRRIESVWISGNRVPPSPRPLP